jgi:hypothetical protein
VDHRNQRDRVYGRIPDGDTVLHHQEPAPGPPVTRRQLCWGWVCVGLVAVAVLIGVLR